jgi:hypothetical protein
MNVYSQKKAIMKVYIRPLHSVHIIDTSVAEYEGQISVSCHVLQCSINWLCNGGFL